MNVPFEKVDLPPLPVERAAGAIRRNLGGEFWIVLAIRGYGGLAEFAIDPFEQTEQWRQRYIDKLTWTIADTPLRQQLPELEPLIAAVPGVKQRIWLLRVRRGASLARSGRDRSIDLALLPLVSRIHIAVTGAGVSFESSGLAVEVRPGEAWRLDIASSYKATNRGGCDAIHLVMDVEG